MTADTRQPTRHHGGAGGGGAGAHRGAAEMATSGTGLEYSRHFAALAKNCKDSWIKCYLPMSEQAKLRAYRAQVGTSKGSPTTSAPQPRLYRNHTNIGNNRLLLRRERTSTARLHERRGVNPPPRTKEYSSDSSDGGRGNDNFHRAPRTAVGRRPISPSKEQPRRKTDPHYTAVTGWAMRPSLLQYQRQRWQERMVSRNKQSSQDKSKTSRDKLFMAQLEDRARRTAHAAMKNNMVFTVDAPYPISLYLRTSLRKRSWVEKFRRLHIPAGGKIQPTNDNSKAPQDSATNESSSSDSDYECDPTQYEAPWEEENGFYSIMSRLVRNCPPTFIWAGTSVNNMFLQNSQIVNHFPKAKTFASKTGLCSIVKEVPWYADTSPDNYFPRCYILNEDEKDSFIEDFRLSACMGVLKWVVETYSKKEDKESQDKGKDNDPEKSQDDESKEDDDGSHGDWEDAETVSNGNKEDEEDDDDVSENDEEDDDDDNEDEDDSDGNPKQTCDNDDNDDKNEDVNGNSPRKTSKKSKTKTKHRKISSPRRTSKSKHVRFQSSKLKHLKKVPDRSPRKEKAFSGRKDLLQYNNTDSKKDKTKKEPELESFVKEKSGGEVPMRALIWALWQVQCYLDSREHGDIDAHPKNEVELSEEDWELQLSWYYKLVHDNATMPVTVSKLEEAESLLEKISAVWKQSDMDGKKNIWIVKPGASSQGNGIVCMDRLSEILSIIENTSKQNFIVQKYIERPLLVHKTKFDIRQWFLVTDWNPLTIWVYKLSYLRICSQEFDLENMHEAIHLSNVSVQKNYTNSNKRSSELPDDNVWTQEKFNRYLEQQGFPAAWEEVIYPGMKAAVISTMLSTQDVAEPRKSAFELYGADFMLSESCTPWLIEINASPGMAVGTKDKNKLCQNVIEDTIKVVLDHKNDKGCDTGNFELAFCQPAVPNPKCTDAQSIYLQGSKIRR